MADTGFLPKEKIKTLLEALSSKYHVFVPTQQGGVVLFRPYAADATICFDRPANLPPKSVIFPQSETLFTFSYRKDTENSGKASVELMENLEVPATLIFGCRPCDAEGFAILDRVYVDTDIPDPYYRNRREKTTIVSLACEAPSPGCFCTAVGRGPAAKEASDLLMTEIQNGFFFEAVTEKGKAVLQSELFEDGSDYQEQAKQAQEKAAEGMRKPFSSTEDIPQKVLARFEDDAFWGSEAEKCISCGACTYLCPTCYCFNITDEQVGANGERIRSWDSCMFYHFTLEASGHNPRSSKHQRLKNRVGHKFSYYPSKYNGVIACCGCGRCIRYCPASVDISEIVSHCQEHTNG
ncbi:MAG TPA: 4Fe-4S dicluster domain-containing protein [Thermodesulfobacteriota bacterium]|nr:4Fe-4S dicluster domain-containing protein [Deltaproteobacteria bacterium]HNR12438.1 4Fe-4S dicluster domain-containing protein [Thermodesulfobacteriota bacterium]HNU73198.1 4Fe-4S dicluster domain-containing protein [Thermodesulfobacteriota bacterium]HOC38676.1 4Fe-4S dicluster domain-containing protein [Thermodesulfobacteriota bacterium]HQO77276.1 4Fe-4S dicluster domain-containing protein [Thermodesulfobacteriota bacterium]